MIFTGGMLKILPDPNDALKSWYPPGTHTHGLSQEDSIFLATVIPAYLNAVNSNNLATANELVKGIATYQRTKGAAIIPSKGKIDFEITYNRMKIFNNLGKYFGLLGFIMLIFVFVEVVRKSKAIGYIIKAFAILIILGFLFQTAGLIMRWYISGHAPWSNGYESMI